MVASNFAASLKAVLTSEGGNDDDPADHGGRTSRGITQREYDAWMKEQDRAPRDVWTASNEDVAAIYRSEYWGSICTLLPIGIDYLYFDMAVNAGPDRAARLLQEALAVNVDGRIGPVTREAIRHVNPEKIIERYSTIKANWYRSLHQPRFLKGWLNRTKAVHDIALKMVNA